MMHLKSWLKTYLISKRSYQFLVKDWVALKDLKPAAELLNTSRFSRNIKPILHGPIQNKRILVIAPHPDDEILGPGGAILKAIENHSSVCVLYLTNGAESQADQLKKEALHVASRVGYSTLFMDYFAGNLPINSESLAKFSSALVQYAPDIVFLPFCLDDHDDHRRASHLLLEAKRQNLLNIEFTVWAYQIYTNIMPSVVMDITDVAETKKALIELWTSQSQKRDWVQFSLGLNAYNVRYLPYYKKGAYAETYFVLPVKAYIDLCSIYFLPEYGKCYYLPQYQT